MNDFKFEQDLVRALLQEQHPDLADLELTDVNGGWDDQLWRLGQDLAVRLPRTERAPILLRAQQTWLPTLATRLPLPTPVPARIGEPSPLFGHTWTITRWVNGTPADRTPITRPDAAETLANFLGALHHPAPPNAPANPPRGLPLTDLPPLDNWFALIADYAHADAVRELFDKSAAAPAWQGPSLWLHADLHPANAIVRDGTLVGVIDFGDMCSGDPATDLSAAWILLPDGAAQRFFAAYDQADAATITRARGWPSCAPYP